MNTLTIKSYSSPHGGDRFNNAEQLWFWFLYSKSGRACLQYSRPKPSSHRVCELLDVETLITKLYLSGKLTTDQLDVMKRFGDKKRAPNPHIWAENRDAAMWRSAMATITADAIKKGWIE